jgi:LMBR1 domain-containing protein 1
VLSVVLLGCVVIFLIKFSHPDDKNVAVFPKVVVVSGLWLAAATILVLPFDIANTYSSFSMGVLWEVLYVLVAVYIFALIPFAYFFYESDVDPNEKQGCLSSQLGQSMTYTIVTFVVFAAICTIMYAFMGTAEIPYSLMRQSAGNMAAVTSAGVVADLPSPPGCAGRWCRVSEEEWVVPVTLPVYVIAFLAFLGWFFFAVFVGVGLAALPMDLINE